MTFGTTELIIVLGIAVLIFGTKKLRNMGSDLGAAVKGFRKAVTEGEGEETKQIGETTADATFDSEPQQASESDKTKTS